MSKDEWSEDELDDVDETVVPISNLPTPQVISNGATSGAETQYRASAYNERMARARQASRKTLGSGVCDLTACVQAARRGDVPPELVSHG